MRYRPFLLLCLGLLFFVPFLGSVHLFDWDEINFAESAREMLLSDNFTRVQIGFQAFWEKPPLFFWLQSAAMQVVGINEWGARLPNALFGIITLLSLYFVGQRWYNKQFGWWWAMCYLGSFLPHLYFKSGIIDPVFNYFIFCSILCLIEALHLRSNTLTASSPPITPANVSNNTLNTRYFVLAGLFAGLAVLTKGPVGFLLIALTVFVFTLLQLYNRRHINYAQWLSGAVLFLVTMSLVSVVWVAPEILKNGTGLLREFIVYQIRLFSTADAGHQQPLYYHWVVVLLGCFPMSLLALPTIFGWIKLGEQDKILRQIMLCLFMVVMVVFTIVKTKIVHYSSMSYLPLSFLAALYINRLAAQKALFFRSVRWGLLVIGGVFSLLLVALPLVAINKTALIPYIKDPFAVGNLQVAVAWGGWEWLIGLFYLGTIMYAILRLEKNAARHLHTLFLSTATCLFCFTAVVVPKIEQYTQGTAIAFYQSMRGKDVYLETIGFKSYADLFYGQLPPNHRPAQYSHEWLLTGEIDKPAYLITKINRTKLLTKYPDIQLIRTEGGFAFFERLPKPSNN